MRESRIFRDYARRWLELAVEREAAGRAESLALDLSACERLDSTFLGCLVDLHQHFNRPGRTRFVVVAPPAARKSLLGVSRLDRLLPILDEPPATHGEGVSLLEESEGNAHDLGVHVMECHRRLAEQGGPASEAFARVAEQLERELGAPH